MKIKYCLALCLLLCAACFESCKKGCTNPTAYNYVKTAKVEDGSCLYCDSSFTAAGSSQVFISDNNPSSPFFNQTVISCLINSNFVQYTGNGCPLLGHTNASTSDTVATYYTGTLQNETSSTIIATISLEIEIFTNNGQVVLPFTISNVTIPPNGSTNVHIGPGGQQLEFSSFSIFVQSSTLSYH